MTLELVIWRDAYFDTDPPSKDRPDFIVQTVGWTKEEENFLAIRSEKLPKTEDPRWRAITHVPWGMIIKRVKLGETE
jgi:hypothetical protein